MPSAPAAETPRAGSGQGSADEGMVVRQVFVPVPVKPGKTEKAVGSRAEARVKCRGG
jgi:hypothetical protein